jgi:co-chaperonin GroES (HSP10)|tara:strand:+ start:255 stop:578 length:324 start_codon:yes stop_codon:yes gene_type:complete
MSRIPPVLKPVNRHLTIVPHVKKNETSSGVILPDDFEIEEDRYITATVMDVAADCSSAIRTLRGSGSGNRVVVVDRSMIEEIVVRDKSYYTILENYVVGILRGIDEN